MLNSDLGKVVPFKPRSTDAEAILDQFITEAQTLPFVAALGIDWSSNTWDLSYVAKPERAGAYVRFTFPELSPKLLDFMKAYVIHEVASNFPTKYQIGKYSAPVKSAKYVQQAMDQFRITNPVDLTPKILNHAMNLFPGAEYTKEQNRTK